MLIFPESEVIYTYSGHSNNMGPLTCGFFPVRTYHGTTGSLVG